MSVYIEKDRDRYRVRQYSGGKRRTLKTCETRAEAERERYLQETLIARGEVMEPEGLTVLDWVDSWMIRRRGTGRIRSINTEEGAIRKRLAPEPIAHLPVQSVRPVDVEDYIEDLAGRFARDTVRQSLRLLRQALDDAVRREIIAANPCAAVRVPRVATAAAEEKWTFLTAEEIAAVFALDLGAERRAIYSVAIYAGLRRGELFALQWGDVDLGPRPHAWVRRGHTGAPKSGKARRVPLLGPVVEALRTWRPECPAPTSLVFPGGGGRMRNRGYQAGWADKRYRKGGELRTGLGVKSQAGITRHVRFHDLRHTCASHLVMGTWGRSWRLEEVRELLGHSTVQLTERYAHLAPGVLDRAAAETVARSCPQASTDDLRKRLRSLGGRGRGRTDDVLLVRGSGAQRSHDLAALAGKARAKVAEGLDSVGSPDERQRWISLGEAALDVCEALEETQAHEAEEVSDG